MTTEQKLREALEEIAWSNDSKWQADRARAALAQSPAPEQQENEADELLRNLGLDPERYRTEAGFINHLKVKAAIRHPEQYPQIVAPEQQAPQGWKLVPVKLDEKMVQAAGVECAPFKSEWEVAQELWDRLLAASPAAPEDGPLPNEPKPCLMCDPSVGVFCDEHAAPVAAKPEPKFPQPSDDEIWGGDDMMGSSS